MTRGLGRFAVVVACLALAACSGTSDGAPASAPATERVSAAPSTETPPSTEPSTDGASPTAGRPSSPATTAGNLSLRSFPTPKALGPQWRHFVDPGNAEDGYLGNGTPAIARSVEEVVRTAVPLGCRRPAAMPAPAHALEVDYVFAGTTVIGIKAQFTDAKTARAFFEAREQNLRGCRGDVSVPAEGVLVGQVLALKDSSVLSDRTPHSAPWSELASIRGGTVLLLAAQAPLGTPPLTQRSAPRLAKAFL